MIEAARAQGRIFGEPFGDQSAVPTHTVCALARRHATVAVSGDGGDEVFAGYRRYRLHTLTEAARRLLPAPMRGRVIGEL
ncbi:MAG: asparagine synthase-related protein, partial [Acetobacteraceae bacterium]